MSAKDEKGFLTTGVMYSEGSDTSGESYISLMNFGTGFVGGFDSRPMSIRPNEDPSIRLKTLLVSSTRTSSGFSGLI